VTQILSSNDPDTNTMVS